MNVKTRTARQKHAGAVDAGFAWHFVELMMTTDPIDPARYPRRYHMQVKMILAPVIGITLALVAITLTEPVLDDFFWWYAAATLSLASIGSLVLASIRCTLYVDRIEYIRPMRRITLQRTAIKGYRMKGWWKRVFLVLEPIDPSQKPLRIKTAFFNLDAAWADWMAAIPALDSQPADQLPWSQPSRTFCAAPHSDREDSEGKRLVRVGHSVER